MNDLCMDLSLPICKTGIMTSAVTQRAVRRSERVKALTKLSGRGWLDHDECSGSS